MSAREFLFTSESVTEGHPDKIADQVSDTVLDAVLADDPDARCACETLITTGLVVVAGEISTETYVDISKLVDDATYKDAISAASTPAKTTFIAYADASELAPIVQLLASTLGGGKGGADQSLGANLEHVGTVVAWGSKDGGNSALHVWLQPR